MKIKLCGFTEKNSLKAAIDQSCDFLGFVFYEKSPRFISVGDAKILSPLIPSNIAKVAVVVDPTLVFLHEISQNFLPDFFQFHGNETKEFLSFVRKNFPKIKIIKAFKISNDKDLELVKDFEEVADLFLFDSSSAGSGQKFDWKILHNFSSKKDWFLSGGINITNIDQSIEITGANMIDVSSGIEKVRGKKSPELIIDLMRKFNVISSRNL